MSAPLDVVLIRGTELIKLPVVSVASGEALADVKDVLYDPDQGAVLGFTLNKRGGLLAGPLKRALPLQAVTAIGRDAVMIAAEEDLEHQRDEAAAVAAAGGARNVLGNEVLTDAGERLGTVSDLIVEIGRVGTTRAGDVVGYQIVGDEALQGRAGAELLVPLPHTLAISGTHLVVPASVGPYVRNDLSGFGLAVDEFRSQLASPLNRGSAS